MSADRPYTDADVETVAAVLDGRLRDQPGVPPMVTLLHSARAVLDALTAAGWMRGHCPSCDCPDVPYNGAPPLRRLSITPPEKGEQDA